MNTITEEWRKSHIRRWCGSMRGVGSHIHAAWSWIVDHGDRKTKLVWINPKVLADEIGDTVERMTEAVAFLSAPDDASQSPEEHGRRLIPVDGYIYQIVNYDKYQACLTEEQRKEYMRKYMQGYRGTESADDSVNTVNTPVNNECLRKRLPSISVSDSISYSEKINKIIAWWNEVATRSNLPLCSKRSAPSLAKLNKHIHARLESYPTKAEWTDMFASIEADADLLRESWFGIDFVMRNDDNWMKVKNRWMSWRRKRTPGVQGNAVQIVKARTEGEANMRKVEEQMKGHRRT